MAYTQVASLTDFTAGTTIVSAEVDANFAAIRDVVNALITGTDTIVADTINEATSNSGVSIGDLFQWSATSGITASSTQSQGQQPLTTTVNEISVVGTANDVVTLPAAVAGRVVAVKNAGAETLDVYPASGDNIEGLAADTALSLASGSARFLIAHNATEWLSF